MSAVVNQPVLPFKLTPAAIDQLRRHGYAACFAHGYAVVSQELFEILIACAEKVWLNETQH